MSPSKTFKISRVPAVVALDDPIAAFLRPLPHTGRAGFEGLVAYLLQQQLGQRFRMAASGPQEGMDAQAEPGPAGANLIKVEAKHYFRSELSLRELTAEIVQACRDDGCDLWVLACTCAVPTQIAALEKEAQKHGAECVFLDRPSSGIDRLAILMATHEESVFLWASRAGATVNEPALRVAFTEIKTRSEYEETKAQLATKLASTLVGYVDASKRAGREFLSVLADSRTSESLFNQNVAVLAGEVRRIRRTSVESAFDDWWRGGKPASPHLAVLGEEGQGKTWALMGWLADLARSDELPLLLSCNSSVDIQRGDTLEDLLPKLLKTWTGLKTIDWWTTRLSHWIARPKSDSPPILIVVDGLNENAAINWVDFFRPVLHKRWEGKVAVIARRCCDLFMGRGQDSVA